MPVALLIDDEAGIRFALRRWFERQGWKVQEAADGEEALTRIRASSDDGSAGERIDIVICDVNLPKRTGSQLLALLRTERPALAARTVLSTGDDIGDAPRGSVLHEHPNVLQKPFDLLTLKALVESLSGQP